SIPDVPDTALYLELCRMAQGRLRNHRPPEAQALLWNAVASSPQLKAAWVMLAGMCFKTGDLDLAVSVLEQARHALPAETDLSVALAGLLAQLDRLDE